MCLIEWWGRRKTVHHNYMVQVQLQLYLQVPLYMAVLFNYSHRGQKQLCFVFIPSNQRHQVDSQPMALSDQLPGEKTNSASAHKS